MINPATDCGGPIEWAHALILPRFTFALLYAALYTQMIGANVLETMNEDYVRTARAKGASEGRVMTQHTLRNAPAADHHHPRARNRPSARRRDLHQSGVRAARSGQDRGPVAGGLRHADRAGDGGLLDHRDHRVINLVVDLVYAWVDPRIRLS